LSHPPFAAEDVRARRGTCLIKLYITQFTLSKLDRFSQNTTLSPLPNICG
jgi:hypothetical protein